MRGLLAGLALIALAAVPAHAQVSFQGEWLVVASAGTCTDYDPVGSHAVARFRPRIAGQAENPSGATLNLFEQRNAKGFRLETGNFTSTFKPVETMYMGNGFGPDDQVTATLVRFDSQVPATLTTTTDFIQIVGRIANYDFMQGCQITFRLALTRRID